MFKSKFKLLIILLLILINASGCVSFTSSKKKAQEKKVESEIPQDGGFYSLGRDKENNYSWSQDVYLATTLPQKPDFKDADILTIVVDPQDNKAFYLGTNNKGLYYTYDAGKNWFKVDRFEKNKITAIKISYKNKCLIYVSTGSELHKSEDCSRTWTRVYNETREGFYISALDIDSYNEGVVYMGLSLDTKKKNNETSDIVKSFDFAESWQTIHRVPLGTAISKIIVNQRDTRIIYAATDNLGLVKSIDGGMTWTDITGEKQEIPKPKPDDFEQRFEKLIDFTKNIDSKKNRDSLVFRDMILLPDEDDTIIHASNYGLLHSGDGGETWDVLKLIPPESEEKAIIYSLSSHPTNGAEFYYGTDDTVFKTVDRGQNWTTIKGPGTRAIYEILATDTGGKETNIYVGVYNIKPPAKKKK